VSASVRSVPETDAQSNGHLLSVKHLVKHFPVTRGALIRRHAGWVRAVDDVSFNIEAGETLGLVGESGCGKTTTGNAVMQLEAPTSGEVVSRGAREEARRARLPSSQRASSVPSRCRRWMCPSRPRSSICFKTCNNVWAWPTFSLPMT